MNAIYFCLAIFYVLLAPSMSKKARELSALVFLLGAMVVLALQWVRGLP